MCTSLSTPSWVEVEEPTVGEKSTWQEVNGTVIWVMRWQRQGMIFAKDCCKDPDKPLGKSRDQEALAGAVAQCYQGLGQNANS